MSDDTIREVEEACEWFELHEKHDGSGHGKTLARFARQALASRQSEPGTVDEEAKALFEQLDRLVVVRILGPDEFGEITTFQGINPQGEELIAAAMRKLEEAAGRRAIIELAERNADRMAHYESIIQPRAEVEASEEAWLDDWAKRYEIGMGGNARDEIEAHLSLLARVPHAGIGVPICPSCGAHAGELHRPYCSGLGQFVPPVARTPRGESEKVGFDGMTDKERHKAVVRSYDEMKASYDAETRRAEAAEAEIDALREGLRKMVESPAIWSPAQYAYSARRLLDEALLRAEKPGARTCETCGQRYKQGQQAPSVVGTVCNTCGPGYNNWMPKPAASDGKGE